MIPIERRTELQLIAGAGIAPKFSILDDRVKDYRQGDTITPKKFFTMTKDYAGTIQDIISRGQPWRTTGTVGAMF